VSFEGHLIILKEGEVGQVRMSHSNTIVKEDSCSRNEPPPLLAVPGLLAVVGLDLEPEAGLPIFAVLD